MKDVVVEIRGGALQASYSDDKELRITLIDWDNFQDEVDSSFAGQVPCVPISSMPDDTSKAFRHSKIVQ